MNGSAHELLDAIERMTRERNAAGYQLRQLHKWLDEQPAFIQERWKRERDQRRED